MAFYFDRMGRWLEEGEEIVVHPRDPYHRVDVVSTDRHIRVLLEGEVLAETDRALALFESNLPPRWYIPREDVRAELTPSDTVTRCPYKGTASYYSVKRADGGDGTDLIWYYTAPLAEVGRIAEPALLLQREGRHRARRGAAGAPRVAVEPPRALRRARRHTVAAPRATSHKARARSRRSASSGRSATDRGRACRRRGRGS